MAARDATPSPVQFIDLMAIDNALHHGVVQAHQQILPGFAIFSHEASVPAGIDAVAAARKCFFPLTEGRGVDM
jgi:hypothetical protein